MKKIITAIALALVFALTACACNSNGLYNGAYPPMSDPSDNYVHDKIEEVGYTNVADDPSSYFSLDRNTATYSLVRKQIELGYKIDPTSVRIEEMINYFDYDYPVPENDDAVRVSGYLADCPWNEEHKLLTVGVKTRKTDRGSMIGNYVLLIDVSGSMSGPNRIGLVKKGVRVLVDNLTENDRVAIVTYANGVDLALQSISADAEGKAAIIDAVENLAAGGGTSGQDGLAMAYDVAAENSGDGINSRVILMTDGDFNIGASSTNEMKEFIKEQAETGVYLSVFGFGMGNARDDMMETLARNGNGNYAYIDSESEIYKAFGSELDGTLLTVAKDAKAGVTFTDNVIKYRLIGYDSKHISEEEFDDPDADTGEIGTNLTVTAMYEIELVSNAEGDIATAEIRYKAADGDMSDQSATTVVTTSSSNNDAVKFAACVAEYGLLLRESAYKGTASFADLLSRLNSLAAYIGEDKLKNEFVDLVSKTSDLYA